MNNNLRDIEIEDLNSLSSNVAKNPNAEPCMVWMCMSNLQKLEKKYGSEIIAEKMNRKDWEILLQKLNKNIIQALKENEK